MVVSATSHRRRPHANNRIEQRARRRSLPPDTGHNPFFVTFIDFTAGTRLDQLTRLHDRPVSHTRMTSSNKWL